MYTNSQNKVIIQNLDNEAFSWFTYQFSFNIALQLEWQARALCIWTEAAQGRNLTMVNCFFGIS
jgi:hypothetical protein